MGLCHRTLKKPFTKPLPSSVALFCSAYSPNALQPTITHQLSLLTAMNCRAWHRWQVCACKSGLQLERRCCSNWQQDI